MLQNIRRNLQGTIAKVIVAIIVVPFALFGIESLLSGGGVQFVAEVNGQGISAVDLQQQINQQKRRLLLSMGENIDPAMLDDQMLAGPALDFMIRKELLLQSAKRSGLAVSDTQLGEIIAAMPVFQTAGSFDPDLYRRVVSDQGYSPGGFQKALREDLLLTQLRAGLASSEFATPAEVELLAAIDEEQRDIRYLVMPLESFRDTADLSDAEIEAWYGLNQDRFTTQESVVLSYIELTLEDFRKPIDEARLRELYQIEKDNFQLPEERRVSHILFELGEDESEAELLARVAATQAALATADASFAELAAELSQDVGSAAFGGDLGFTSGDTFPPEMEAAIASTELNAVSAPVQTDAGWHLIQVTEIRPGENLDFDSVRDELQVQLQDEEAARELVTTVENLRNLVFNADDLMTPAAELELDVQRSEPVLRGQAEGLFADPRLNTAAFSSEVLGDRFNSEVIELDSEHFVVLRVLEHSPAAALELDLVRDEVVQALAQERARERALAQADTLLERLQAGASIEELALESGYEWQVELAAKRSNRSAPATMLRRAFQLSAPESGQSSFDYVQDSDGDIVVFQLARVVEGDPQAMPMLARAELRSQISQELGRRADANFQQELRSKADVVRN